MYYNFIYTFFFSNVFKKTFKHFYGTQTVYVQSVFIQSDSKEIFQTLNICGAQNNKKYRCMKQGSRYICSFKITGFSLAFKLDCAVQKFFVKSTQNQTQTRNRSHPKYSNPSPKRTRSEKYLIYILMQLLNSNLQLYL